MKEFFEIYVNNPWLIATHLLMLSVIIYALVRVGRHPGPSICVIFACLLNFANFLSWFVTINVFDISFDSRFYTVFEHFRSAGWLASSILLYVAVFGWRSNNKRNSWTVGTMNTPQGRPVMADGAAATGTMETRLQILYPKRASYALWVILVILSSLLSIFGIILLVVGQESYEDGLVILGGVLIALAVVLAIWFVVLMYIYIYRMWWMLPVSYARTSPGKAVGFCFIPFFNLYWVFVAYYGWSKDYNRFLQETGRPYARRMSEGLFLTMCIFIVLGAIPFINYLLIIPNMIISIIVFYKICSAINSMADEGIRSKRALSVAPEEGLSQ